MSLVRSFPAATFLYFTLLNLVTAIPFALYPDRAPWFLSDKNPIESNKWLLILIASAGNSMILITILILLSYFFGRRLTRWVGTLLLTVLYISLTAASFYFLEFGSYPGWELIIEGFRSPKLIAGYAAYGAEKQKLIAFLTVCLPVILSVFLSLRNRPLTYASLHTFVMSAICSLAFIACIVWGSRLNVEYKVYSSFANLSLPIFKLWDEIIGRPTTNAISLVKSYLPVAVPLDHRPIAAENLPRHVVLVITESLRHDHLPIYGYGRNTTPKMTAESSNWIAIERFYAHGPWTAASFSIMFSSRYLAAVSEGALAVALSNRFWQALSARDINTAFISSGDLEWGGVSSRIGSTEIKYVVGSREATPEQRKRHQLDDQIDNSLSDRFALEHYETFLTNSNSSTFATLFLMGTHFPYRPVDKNVPFQPTFTLGQSFSSANDKRLRYINSYDNSIVGLDTIIDELLKILRRRNYLDNSMIMVTGDHGESLGEMDNYYHGFQLTEDQVHVPLLIYSGTALGEVKQRLQNSTIGFNGHIDIAPTVLELFSLPVFEDHQGYSMLSHVGKTYEVIPYASLARKVAMVTSSMKYIYDFDSSAVSTELLSAQEKGSISTVNAGTGGLSALYSSEANLNGASFEQFLNSLAEKNIIARNDSP